MGGARDRASVDGQLEAVVAQHGPWRRRTRARSRRPAPARASIRRPDAHVGRRDVPAPVVAGHPERLTLTGHGTAASMTTRRVAQPVVDPAGAEHGVLHLRDQGVVGPASGSSRYVRGTWSSAPRRPRGGPPCRPGRRDRRTVRADHLEWDVGRRTPRLGRGPVGDELGLGRRDASLGGTEPWPRSA